MDIERAGIANIDELVELRLAFLSEDNGALEDDVKSAILLGLPDYYREHLNKDLLVYVARVDQQIVSCAFLLVAQKPMNPAFVNGRTGSVMNVYTRPPFRKKGYASEVMRRLLEDARRLDLSLVELKATDAGYPLYRSVGFTDDNSTYHPMRWTNPAIGAH